MNCFSLHLSRVVVTGRSGVMQENESSKRHFRCGDGDAWCQKSTIGLKQLVSQQGRIVLDCSCLSGTSYGQDSVENLNMESVPGCVCVSRAHIRGTPKAQGLLLLCQPVSLPQCPCWCCLPSIGTPYWYPQLVRSQTFKIMSFGNYVDQWQRHLLGGRALDNDSGNLGFVSDCATGLFMTLEKLQHLLGLVYPLSNNHRSTL